MDSNFVRKAGYLLEWIRKSAVPQRSYIQVPLMVDESCPAEISGAALLYKPG